MVEHEYQKHLAPFIAKQYGTNNAIYMFTWV
jgi:hypothetical protein